MMMKSVLTLVAVLFVLLISAGAAAGQGRQTLSTFLGNCKGSEQNCIMMTYNVIQAGRSSRYICVPRNVTLEDAAAKQLDWLKQEVGNNPRFGNEDLEEAQWTAADKLWPCNKK
jgi:hypothetical protein